MAIIYYVDKNNNHYVDDRNNFYIHSMIASQNKYYSVLYLNGKFRKVKPYIATKFPIPENTIALANGEMYITQNNEYFVTADSSLNYYNLRQTAENEEDKYYYQFVKYKPYIERGT